MGEVLAVLAVREDGEGRDGREKGLRDGGAAVRETHSECGRLFFSHPASDVDRQHSQSQHRSRRTLRESLRPRHCGPFYPASRSRPEGKLTKGHSRDGAVGKTMSERYRKDIIVVVEGVRRKQMHVHGRSGSRSAVPGLLSIDFPDSTIYNTASS